MKTYLVALFGLALLIFAGCEDDDSFPHRPPEGKGSLVVDNRTYVDVRVYLNGYLFYEVDDYDYEIADLEPGVYRVVVDERGGEHSYRDDIDIIANKLTILQIKDFEDSSTFRTRIYFD